MSEQKPVAYRHRDGMFSFRLPGGGVLGIDWAPLYDQAAIDALTAEVSEYKSAQKDLHAWRNSYREQIDLALRQRDALLAALEKFMDAHEECSDFDGYTAQIVSMDDYHEAQDTITSVKGGAA